MADYSSELHPDEMCPNCVTPWKCNGPHYTPEQAEAWKAGREAGMREAAAIVGTLAERPYDSMPEFDAILHAESAILSAIGGDK